MIIHRVLINCGIYGLLTALLMACVNTYAAQFKELKGLRDSVVWLRSQGNETINIQWKDWYAGDSTINYIYIQSPQGKLIDKIKINYGKTDGEKSYQLSQGVGDYRIEFPGYFYRKAGVSVDNNMPLVLQPAKGHFSFHSDGSPLYFSVPETHDRFALCGRYNNGPGKILLFNPDNAFQDELVLDKKPGPLNFDCLKIEHAVSGSWRIQFDGKGKIAFWLDGIDNYFALKTEDLFTPVLEDGQAVISSRELIIKPMGKIGSQMVNEQSDKRIFDAIAYMGLSSFNHYINHSWREPFNPDFPNGGDNDNPFVMNQEGFHWEDQRLDLYRKELNAQISSIFNSRNSWLGLPLTPDKQKEYAEFVFEYVNHVNNKKNYDMQWFSLWDEPNITKFTYKQYESLLKTVGIRLKLPSNPEKVLNTSLLAISSAGWDVNVKGKKHLGREWAKNIYASHDELVDGIAFDYWYIRDLIELWRFNDVINQVRKIMLENDTDGNTDEAIVINQTSMSAGIGSSAYDVNSHFGALWLAGAVCNAFNSGHLDAFHYFPTVDDRRHMKGLLYSDTLPMALPFGPEAKAYEIKPIGHSMAMINDTVLDRLISVDKDSLEVDALATVADDDKAMSILVVNKFPRQTETSIVLTLPPELLHQRYALTVKSFGPTHKKPETLVVDKPFRIAQKLRLDYSLAGETIYAFNLRRVDKE